MYRWTGAHCSFGKGMLLPGPALPSAVQTTPRFIGRTWASRPALPTEQGALHPMAKRRLIWISSSGNKAISLDMPWCRSTPPRRKTSRSRSTAPNFSSCLPAQGEERIPEHHCGRGHRSDRTDQNRGCPGSIGMTGAPCYSSKTNPICILSSKYVNLALDAPFSL